MGEGHKHRAFLSRSLWAHGSITGLAVLIVTAAIAKADDHVWLTCSFANSKPGASQITQEEIYVFSEQEKRIWLYDPKTHNVNLLPDSQIEKDKITEWPLGRLKNDLFMLNINRITGSYYRGLPGIADIGSCTHVSPQPLDDRRPKF